METQSNTASANAVRETPLPPGGGSWRFDQDAWAWIENNPQPPEADQQLASADIGADNETNQE